MKSGAPKLNSECKIKIIIIIIIINYYYDYMFFEYGHRFDSYSYISQNARAEFNAVVS